ncbi:hypothetical protein HN789_03610 [archaeon]|jgi:hypothetical protein|nr:hypothetical protein [archaeon]MBT4023048.1 hypothetical protein [archaeon]MBT4272447.1 hypothetical protein [archaeon]MBT4460545.1 hypothetical protein [archaeon]MBT4857865.1 hypothetical protein [archaeon]
MKKTDTLLSKEIRLMSFSFVTIFIIALALKNLALTLKFSFVYFYFIYLPFVPLISKIEISLPGQYLLNNIAGICYASIYVLFDLWFKIPLNKTTFLIVTTLVNLITWGYFFAIKSNSPVKKLLK